MLRAARSDAVPAHQLCFLDSLVTIRVSVSDRQDDVSAIEHRVPMAPHRPCTFTASCAAGVDPEAKYLQADAVMGERACPGAVLIPGDVRSPGISNANNTRRCTQLLRRRSAH